MKFNDIVTTAVSVLEANPSQTIYISGAPGNGKTSAIHEIFKRLGCEHTAIFRPSLHDPVDLNGIPSCADGATHWNTPAWLKAFGPEALGESRAGLGIDEMAQAVVMMQNALAGLMLDKFIGEFKLAPNVFMIATGNRTKDKAGANRVVSQLANRVMHLEMESDLDGWCDWALDAGLPVWVVSFLRFRPNLLNAFDPERFSNPTERTWEMVGRLPEGLATNHYFSAVSGLVGEGAAAEVTGFKQIMDKMPDPDYVIMRPEEVSAPTDPATLYALMGALSVRSTKDNFDRVCTFLAKCPVEFQVMAVKDSLRLNKEVRQSGSFVKWATKNASVFM